MSFFGILCRSRSLPLHALMLVVSAALLAFTFLVIIPHGAAMTRGAARAVARHHGVFSRSAAALAPNSSAPSRAAAAAQVALPCKVLSRATMVALSECVDESVAGPAVASGGTDASAVEGGDGNATTHYELHVCIPTHAILDALLSPRKFVAMVADSWLPVLATMAVSFIVVLSLVYEDSS